MSNEYPKVCQSRTCRHSSVVVANAEQEAELPDDFRPDAPAEAEAVPEKRKYTRKE